MKLKPPSPPDAATRHQARPGALPESSSLKPAMYGDPNPYYYADEPAGDAGTDVCELCWQEAPGHHFGDEHFVCDACLREAAAVDGGPPADSIAPGTLYSGEDIPF